MIALTPLVRTLLRPATPGLILCGLLLGASGCADMVASSKPSRRQGLQHFSQGAYVDAAGSFRNAVRQDPRDYKSHYYLGASYDALKSYHQAIQSYRAALDVMSLTLDGRGDKEFRQRILDGLALTLAKAGDRTLETDALAGGRVTPAEVKYVEGKVLRNLGDADSALSSYKQAFLLDPRDFNIAREYGLYLESLGQTPEAKIVLQRAYALNSRDPQVKQSLERLGVVPGPSLKERDELVKPRVPEGPLPQVDLSKIGFLNPPRGEGRGDAAQTAGAEVAAPVENTGGAGDGAEAFPRD